MDDKNQERNKFYSMLAGCRVFIPCKRQENGSINLEILISNQGHRMIPAFFSKESQIGNFDKQTLTEFEFSMLRNVLIELPREISGIVIEPFKENIILDRKSLAEYDSAVQGMTVEKHDHLQNTSYFETENLPKNLITAVDNFLREQIGVNAVWALLSKNENEKIPHLTFVIDYIGNKFELFPKFAEVVKPFMRPGQSFELIDAKPQMKEFLNDKTCIYRRKGSVQ